MNYNQAYKIVSTWVEVSTDGAAEINAVTDKPYGWIFFYQAKDYESNDISTHLGGNAPVIFDRATGEIRVTGTAQETEYYVKAYEATLPKARLAMKPEVSGFEEK